MSAYADAAKSTLKAKTAATAVRPHVSSFITDTLHPRPSPEGYAQAIGPDARGNGIACRGLTRGNDSCFRPVSLRLTPASTDRQDWQGGHGWRNECPLEQASF